VAQGDTGAHPADHVIKRMFGMFDALAVVCSLWSFMPEVGPRGTKIPRPVEQAASLLGPTATGETPGVTAASAAVDLPRALLLLVPPRRCLVTDTWRVYARQDSLLLSPITTPGHWANKANPVQAPNCGCSDHSYRTASSAITFCQTIPTCCFCGRRGDVACLGLAVLLLCESSNRQNGLALRLDFLQDDGEQAPGRFSDGETAQDGPGREPVPGRPAIVAEHDIGP